MLFRSIIIGHAERRAQGETDVDTRAQVASALAAGMTPILCVGEKSRGDSGEHFEVVRAQLQTGLADAGSKIKKIIVAYEPVWSIGAETAMSPRDMHEMAIFIRKIIIDAHGEVGHAVKIIYGGSVDESNAIIMLKEGDVHGLLIGRASQDSKVFWSLLHAIENA